MERERTRSEPSAETDDCYAGDAVPQAVIDFRRRLIRFLGRHLDHVPLCFAPTAIVSIRRSCLASSS